tara:strand:- start:36775 stop:37731 length:957 start_codon:yes stop_codon:yes gene_type:complete
VRKLAIASLLLVIALVSLSAYLRLNHSGIGCANWPVCYGQIGPAAESTPTISSTYERLAAEARQPMSWATPAHRLIASILGLTVLGMALLSLYRRQDRLLTIALLGLTVFLAWLGIHSGGLHSPAVVMGNLGGGFAMLALLGWAVFKEVQPTRPCPRHVRILTIAAILLLLLQIGLGGLTSANFAASACPTLPECNGQFMPGPGLLKAFDLSRSHTIGDGGLALGGPERAAIHQLHRLMAVTTTIVILAAALLALRARQYLVASLVLALTAIEVGVGVAAILSELPIGIAVAHNWLAAMLLLALLRLLALSKYQQASN